MFKRLALPLALILFVVSDSLGDDWSQFLGPNRDGKSGESGLMQTWPKDGPKIAWKAKVGEGMSGCAIVGVEVITMGQDDKNQFVICLSTKDGSELWRTTVAKRYENGQGHGPRATPTISGDFVYVYTGDGVLTKLDKTSGDIKWKVAAADLDGGVNEYGVACSPLVANDQVIINVEAGKGTSPRLVSLSCDDGEVKWKSGSWGGAGEQAGYASPVLMERNGKSYIATLSGSYFYLFDPDAEGRMESLKQFETDYACNTANPIVMDEDHVFISAGENHGCMLLNLNQVHDSNSQQKGQLREVWSSLGPRSVMRNEWQTSIRIGDHLFGFDNQGSAGPITNLSCINWKSGEQLWKVSRFGKSNMIYADGVFWISNMDGQMIAGIMNHVKYSELGRMNLVDTTRQAPSLAAGHLFFRGTNEVVCVDIRAKSYK